MKTLLTFLIVASAAAFASAESAGLSSALEQGLIAEEVNRDFDAAIAAYESAVARFDKERELAATAMFRLAENYRRAGRTEEAGGLYERIVREFRDQGEIARLAAERLPEESVAAVEGGPASSDLSPVTIRIQTEDGRPLRGFRVEMTTSDGSDGRRLQASGLSNDTGLALSRSMPYGEYRLTISEPSGWRTYFHRFVVEFGAPVEKVVVAPDPESRATLNFGTALNKQAFAGLKFGEMQPSPLSFTPEPGEESDRLASFPELGNGIEEVGIKVRISGTRSLVQPDGTRQPWHWHRTQWILVSNEKAAYLSTFASGTARPAESAPYFDGPQVQRSPLGGFGWISFFRVERKPISSEHGLDLPSGEISLRVTRIIGKADRRVISSLDLAETDNVWLEANLRPNSRWPTRILSRNIWEPTTDDQSSHLSHVITVEPGETRSFTFESPPLP